MFTVTGKSHALVNGDLQIHLPAITLGIGAVLPVGHGAFSLLLLLGFHNRQTIFHAQLIGCRPEPFEGLLVAVVLETGITTHGVDHEMRVDVIPVRVGRHYDFEAGDLLRQLQSDFVCLFRGDGIIGMEGLHHMVVHPTFGAVVQPLGIHELLKRALRHTVDTAD